MKRYLVGRIGQALLLVLGVMVIVFLMLRVSGDPTNLLVPREATQEQREAARQAYGLDKTVVEQFVDFVADAARLDFGSSLRYKVPVREVVFDRMPATIELGLAAMALAVAVGVPLGILAGVKAGGRWDSAARGLGLLGQTIPNFWLALVFIVVFAVQLGWLPSFGRGTISMWFFTIPNQSIILPAVALGLFPMAQLLRFTRSSVLEIVNEEYVRIARSKGLRALVIYRRYILRNALIPLISVMSLQVGALLGGSLYIEAVFAWPGAGGLLAEAVSNRDFQLVQGIAFFGALVVIFFSLLADVLYTVADPRIRVGKLGQTGNRRGKRTADDASATMPKPYGEGIT